MILRNSIVVSDVPRIKEMLLSTGFFDQAPDEIDIAIELAEYALKNGNKISNYDFIFAEEDGKVLGYTCFGHTPCTLTTFEIYWIAVDKSAQRLGVGRALADEVFRISKANGGKKVVLYTAGRPLYIPTHKFYESCGFREEARIKNYYDVGDDSVIYTIEI
jgi:Acetyltransferases